MTRDDAYQLLTKYMQNKNLLKHSLAAEAGMRGICRYLYPDLFTNPQKSLENKALEDRWGITGLLHDIDYELAQKENKLDRHGIMMFEDEKYKKDLENIPEEIAHGIKAHNFENTGVMPENNLDWAIACVDALTGLIVACALIHPDKKLDPIDTQFVLKRFSEKSFAKGARRESISRCETVLNIPLEKFIDITLSSMKEIHRELEL